MNRIPVEISLKYSSHAVKEWSDQHGFIKNPPKKFFRYYTKHIIQPDGLVKASYPFVHNKKYQLILVIDPKDGTVITNYLSQRDRNKLKKG